MAEKLTLNNYSNNNKIAKNSMLLYIRMAVVMVINLYIVRIILNALGAQDYGLYNVVAGIVTMLSCITNVLSTSTQRYYSYAMGENSLEKLSCIFSVSFNIYLFFSFIVFLLGETIGLYLINYTLTIPQERLLAANIIFQLSLVTFVFNLLQSPYSSAVIAHEEMNIFAIISLLECLFRLFFAILLSSIWFDKLIFYGFSQCLVIFLGLLAYIFIGRKKYIECHYTKYSDKDLYLELLSFSGWNLFASIAGVGMNQVINILINIFFGPIANAARAISMQIYNALNTFCSSFIMAVRPPMIKAVAGKQYLYLNKVFSFSNKFIFYFLLIIVIPLFCEMESIIYYWLNSNDIQTITFSRLILIYSLILVLNNPISIIMQAIGKVKQYFVPVEVFTLLCPFVVYFLFKLEFNVYSSFYAMIVCAILSHIVRLICLKRYYPIANIKDYVLNFIIPAFIVTAILLFIAFGIHSYLNSSLLRLVCITITNAIFILIYLISIGLTKEERRLVYKLIRNVIK